MLPDFNDRNWISSNRGHHPGFLPRGEGLSDFIYNDREGHLARLFNFPEHLKRGGKFYFLEVKSTVSDDSSFHLSPNQFELVCYSKSFSYRIDTTITSRGWTTDLCDITSGVFNGFSENLFGWHFFGSDSMFAGWYIIMYNTVFYMKSNILH